MRKATAERLARQELPLMEKGDTMCLYRYAHDKTRWYYGERAFIDAVNACPGGAKIVDVQPVESL